MADALSMSTSSMTVEDVSEFLKQGGIPDKFCEVFEENYIDGESFLLLTEQDIKDIVPAIGTVKKILKLREKLLPAASAGQHLSPLPDNLNSVNDSSAQSSPTSSITRDQSTEIIIPEHWRPEVEDCIQNQHLDELARCEVVRTLVNLLFSRHSKPSRVECGALARKLILKYTFMKDDMGNGYQSWEEKMVERVRNVIKRDRKRNPQAGSTSSQAKKPKADTKKKESLLRRYPIGVQLAEDSSSFDSHMSAITTELTKTKPRDTVLLPLMKSTYPQRRLYVQADATSVKEILEIYPCLNRPAIIEQEIELIIGSSDCKQNFLTQWKRFYPAILFYGNNSGKKGMSSLLKDMDDTDETTRQVCALRILALALGRANDNLLVYLYEEYKADVTSVDDAIAKEPIRNSPRIAVMVDDIKRQYFVLVERSVLCEATSMQGAIFLVFAAYYLFNLEYPKKSQGLFYFLQDYILGHPDSLKRPSTYLAVVSDIKTHVQ